MTQDPNETQPLDYSQPEPSDPVGETVVQPTPALGTTPNESETTDPEAAGPQAAGPQAAGSRVEIREVEAEAEPEPGRAPAIEVRGLVKKYGKSGPPALDGIDLIVPRGEIYGFIGPNGAGKTTTLRVLATLTKPTRGFARICGHDCVTDADLVRRKMGYLPDGAPSLADFTVREFLEFFSAAYGIVGKKRREVVDDVLSLVDLAPKQGHPIEVLSLGMRQRLGLARVLLHDPEVLLLDEPGTGLDPRARIEIREILRELRNLEKTILISSHILGELNELCTSNGILEQGQMVFSGTLEAALARVRGASLEVRVGGGDVRRLLALALLERLDAVADVADEFEDDLLRVSLAEGAGPGEVSRALVEAGYELLILRPREIDLEDAFLTLTEGKLA